MNKKLKYFLISFILSSILVCLVFIVFPLIFASLFADSFFPFGGLLGVTIFARFVPAILFISLILFTIIIWKVAEEGTKIKSILIVIIGFVLPLILFWTFSMVNTLVKIADYTETLDQTESFIDLAIKENNPEYCDETSELWKQKESDTRTKSSVFRGNLCYFWLAYSVGEYSYCDKISYREMKNSCLITAGIKTKDTSYCLKSTGYLSPDLEIGQCMGAVSRVVDDVSICNEIKEKYDPSGSVANQCFARYALYSEDIAICEQITNDVNKEKCRQKVSLIGNFEQSCNKEYTCFDEFQCDLEKKSQKLECLADVKMFELDQQGCMDVFEGESYNTCDKINKVTAFKTNKPQLCEPEFLCDGCFNKQTEPTWCDYDYFYYLDRFHEFGVGY
ncbi:MAG: hypothetical protein O2779_05265 [Nanoarchaeota archaeon]|nr:hypothetical protein [Nanoarchaeota archaeon]